MTNTERPERDTMDVGQPEEAELADEELGAGASTQVEKPDDEKAEDELEPLEGGAETMADLDEEGGQANRPGTERPPV
ncbi:MAG TPA: hypothetical protein VNP90_02555 [Actinomycetota bacterium]|nr:hypothetical protein [Actinomycetota bacterium]